MIIPDVPLFSEGALYRHPTNWHNRSEPDAGAFPWAQAPLGSLYTKTAAPVIAYRKVRDTQTATDWAIQETGAPWINAATYGLATTNTAAENDTVLSTILTTIAANEGATIAIPPGNYLYSGLDLSHSAGHWSKNITIRGAGMGATTLTNTHATNHGLKIYGSGSNYPDLMTVESLTLVGNNRASGQYGIALHLARHCTFRDVEIRNYDHGIHFTLAWSMGFDNCLVGGEDAANGNNVGLYMDDTGGIGTTPNSFVATKFTQSTSWGIDIVNQANNVGFINCEIESNLGGGARLSGTATRNVGLYSCTFERNGINNLSAAGTAGDPYILNGPDILVGETGLPTNIVLVSCRFLRPSGYYNAQNAAIRILAGSRCTIISPGFIEYNNTNGTYTRNGGIEFVETDAGNPGNLVVINPMPSNTTNVMVVGRDTTGNPNEHVLLTSLNYFAGGTRQYYMQSGQAVYMGSNQILSTRQTGWTAATNTASRATFDTATVTTAQLAQRVKALLDDLITHGVIGA